MLVRTSVRYDGSSGIRRARPCRVSRSLRLGVPWSRNVGALPASRRPSGLDVPKMGGPVGDDRRRARHGDRNVHEVDRSTGDRAWRAWSEVPSAMDAYVGKVLDFTEGPTAVIEARYRFDGSKQSFTALVHVEQTGLHAVISGVVTDGWGKATCSTGSTPRSSVTTMGSPPIAGKEPSTTANDPTVKPVATTRPIASTPRRACARPRCEHPLRARSCR